MKMKTSFVVVIVNFFSTEPFHDLCQSCETIAAAAASFVQLAMHFAHGHDIECTWKLPYLFKVSNSCVAPECVNQLELQIKCVLMALSVWFCNAVEFFFLSTIGDCKFSFPSISRYAWNALNVFCVRLSSSRIKIFVLVSSVLIFRLYFFLNIHSMSLAKPKQSSTVRLSVSFPLRLTVARPENLHRLKIKIDGFTQIEM